MYESTVNTGKLLMSVAWGWVLGLMLSAWIIAITSPDHWIVAGMLAASSCASSALAAVFHIRTYAVRLCALVRATSAVDASEPTGRAHIPLQPVR